MQCFVMWFAIAPLMPTLKKVKCELPTSEVCVKCFERYSTDNTFYNSETDGPDAPLGAKDKVHLISTLRCFCGPVHVRPCAAVPWDNLCIANCW
jgi:hypothetical protein